MKKIVIALVEIVALSSSAMAQAGSENYAIGARIGYGYAGLDAEASFMWGIGPNLNRIEMDLGFNYYYSYGDSYSHPGLQFTAAYHWRWNIVKGLHWYVGPGATIGTWFSKKLPFSFGVGGQVGLEYDFDAPIQLTLDYRPMINFHPWSNYWGHYNDSFCVGVRYRF